MAVHIVIDFADPNVTRTLERILSELKLAGSAGCVDMYLVDLANGYFSFPLKDSYTQCQICQTQYPVLKEHQFKCPCEIESLDKLISNLEDFISEQSE